MGNAGARLRLPVFAALFTMAFGAIGFVGAAQAQSAVPPRISSLQSEIRNPLNGIEAKTFANEEAKQTAFAQAIASVMRNLITSGAPPALSASLVIETAISHGQNCDPASRASVRTDCVSARAIGIGLADAAAQFANDPAIVSAIAQTIANEGLIGMGEAFAAAFLAAGGSKELASIATSAPIVIATFGYGGGIGGGGFNPGAIKIIIITAILKFKALIQAIICHHRPTCS